MSSKEQSAAEEWVKKWAPTEPSWVDYELSEKAFLAGISWERFRMAGERVKAMNTVGGGATEAGKWRFLCDKRYDYVDPSVIEAIKKKITEAERELLNKAWDFALGVKKDEQT